MAPVAIPTSARRLLLYLLLPTLSISLYLLGHAFSGSPIDLTPHFSNAIDSVRKLGRPDFSAYSGDWSWVRPYSAEELSVETKEELEYDHESARSSWFSPWHRWASSTRSLVEFTSRYSDYLGFRSPQSKIDWDSLSAEVREFKEWEFARALTYEGTGARVQRFLEKARRGEGFVVSVVGGSVSKGRGLPAMPREDGTVPEGIDSKRSTHHTSDPPSNQRATGATFPKDEDPEVSLNLYNPTNLHHLIFSHLDETFPVSAAAAKRGRKNVFVNGAQGGTSSEYFAGCWKEHVPEDSDLILVELGINDMRDMSSMETYELLVRSLLEMPSQPAIINIQTFTLLFPTLSQASSLHYDVAAYYDTPVIAIRDVLLPRILNQGADQSAQARDEPSQNLKKRSTPAAEKPLSRAENEEASLGAIKRGDGASKKAKRGLPEIPEERMKIGKRNSRDAAKEIRKWFRNVEGATEGDAKVVGNVDLMHISQSAHALVAELIIHYLQLQAARMDPKEDFYLEEGYREELDFVMAGLGGMGGIGATDVPGMLLAGHYTPNKHIRRSDPFCRSTNSAFESRKLEPGPRSNGWTKWAWGEKNYVVSSKPGSIFTFDFVTQTPASLILPETDAGDMLGDEDDDEDASDDQSLFPTEAELAKAEKRGEGYVKIGYQRSATYGLGSVDCWVDDDVGKDFGGMGHGEVGRKEKVRVDGWWDIRERNMIMITTIRDDLLPGKHTLKCQLLESTLDPTGGKEFRFISVLYD